MLQMHLSVCYYFYARGKKKVILIPSLYHDENSSHNVSILSDIEKERENEHGVGQLSVRFGGRR